MKNKSDVSAQRSIYELIIEMATNDEKRKKSLPNLPYTFQFIFVRYEDIDYPLIFRLVSDSNLSETNFGNIMQIFSELESGVVKEEHFKMIDKMKRHFQLSFEQKLNFDRMKESFEEGMGNARGTLTNLGETLVETKIDMLKVKEEAAEATESLKQLQMSTNSIYAQFVTILGIFTAIVLSVVGGLQLITSVFDNLYQLPIWKAVMMTSLIALAIICMLFLLTRWVYTVINRAFNYSSERSLMQIFTDNGAFSIGLFIFSYLFLASIIFSSKDITITLKAFLGGLDGIPILVILILPVFGGLAILFKTIDSRK